MLNVYRLEYCDMRSGYKMRIVFWNIQAGGGRRVEGIARQIEVWLPDVVAFAEFRGTPPSQQLAEQLREMGYVHQLSTVEPQTPTMNALLLASMYPLERIAATHRGFAPCRWLLAKVEGHLSLTLGVMHIPNFVTGRKAPFYEGVLDLLDRWELGRGILMGDTNSGLPDIDEERKAFTKLEAGWMQAMQKREWLDCFRHLRGDERAYTWYSPNGRNGFRLDQAFLNPDLLPYVQAMRYDWGIEWEDSKGKRYLSDHAAIVVDFRVALLEYQL
jgi:exonuclease III